MKRLVSVLTAILLLALLAVPASAAENPESCVYDEAELLSDEEYWTLEDCLRRDVDHAVVVPECFQAKVDKSEAHYALLPVWMLTTKWRDKNYLFAMNGQTGKFVGELPTDNALFWRNLGILTLILTLVLRFSGITRFLLGLF